MQVHNFFFIVRPVLEVSSKDNRFSVTRYEKKCFQIELMALLCVFIRFQAGELSDEPDESDEEEEGVEEGEDEPTEDGENKETGTRRKGRKKRMVSADDLKFDQVNDIKSKWEGTQLGRKAVNAEKRREEQIRVRQLMLRVREN